MMKIIADNKIPFLKGRLEPVAEVVYASAGEISPELVREADALIVRTRTACGSALLGQSAVKLVATATIGTDHLDTGWLLSNGIRVANAAGCNAPGVAQYVWSSLLRGGFNPKTDSLGVVGFGHIGSIVADWGRKMGAEVLICDPPRKDAGMTDEDYLPLETLLSRCDAVTLHTPLTRSGAYPTFHLIDEDRLSLMKDGSVLVNASRGPVVDNSAWTRHLSRGGYHAIVDVWEGEPHIDMELLRLADVATPHIAGYSLEGKERATRMALEAVEDAFGVSVCKDGLEGNYASPETVDAATIMQSYDPAADTAMLRQRPEEFDSLRDDYTLRHEPKFLNKHI